MTKVAPTVEELHALRELDHEGPVVVVNLLKFRGAEGRQLWKRYLETGARTMADIEQQIKLIYTGVAGKDLGDGADWDFVVIVEYESVDHFVDTMLHPVWQNEQKPLREQAIERTIFLVTYPADNSVIWQS